MCDTDMQNKKVYFGLHLTTQFKTYYNHVKSSMLEKLESLVKTHHAKFVNISVPETEWLRLTNLMLQKSFCMGTTSS